MITSWAWSVNHNVPVEKKLWPTMVKFSLITLIFQPGQHLPAEKCFFIIHVNLCNINRLTYQTHFPVTRILSELKQSHAESSHKSRANTYFRMCLFANIYLNELSVNRRRNSSDVQRNSRDLALCHLPDEKHGDHWKLVMGMGSNGFEFRRGHGLRRTNSMGEEETFVIRYTQRCKWTTT
mgnify:CR=1 FL=1